MRIPNATLRSILGAVILVALVTGCGEESTGPVSDAPALPPVQSMQIDLGFFGGSGEPGVLPAAGTKLNFMNAAVRAAFVNVAVITILTPPSLAFGAAIHTIPSVQDDGSFLWIYTWVDRGQDHQVRLTGTPDGEWVDWSLSVVLPGASPEVWFTGRSHIGRDEGFWLFRDFNLAGDPEVVRIDWEVNGVNDALLQIANVHAGSDEEGDELRYEADGSARSISFVDASTTDVWDIQWDEQDGTGSLQVPDYHGGTRACWDGNQDDVDCVPES